MQDQLSDQIGYLNKNVQDLTRAIERLQAAIDRLAQEQEPKRRPSQYREGVPEESFPKD